MDVEYDKEKGYCLSSLIGNLDFIKGWAHFLLCSVLQKNL